jgi:hypothetical protein
MAGSLRESLKVDVALAPQAIASTNVTSPYFDIQGYDSALFVVVTGAIAVTKKAVLAVWNNGVAGSSGAAALAGYTIDIAAHVKSAIATIAHSTPDNGDTVTINGVVFTKAAAIEAGTTKFNTAAELNTLINATFSDITSTESGGTITLVSTDPGKTGITLASSEVTNLVPATVAAVGFIEVPAPVAKRWIAARVTTDATITAGVTLIRGDARHLPVSQVVAAGYPA